jgi:adenylate cyclase
VPVITALFAFQAYRIRALARRSAAQEASRAALAAHFAPEIAGLLLPDAERKPRLQHVVAMSCDLVGFTSTAEQAPAEEVAALLRAYRSAVERAVFASGGAIVSFTGDGALAAFGLRDGADAAGRAVASAHSLVRNWSGPVSISVGLAAGDAMVGLAGDGAGAAFLFQGPPVAEADALQQATRAAGVRILASDAVVASLGPDMKPSVRDRVDGAWHIAA